MVFDQHKTGPTGEQPVTNLPGDRGGLNAAIRIDTENQLVVVDFATTITFLAMTADQASAFADVLVQAAEKLRQSQS